MGRRERSLVLAALALLGACSSDEPRHRADDDPAVSTALGQQLMTDPDLARINPENRVLAGGGPAEAPIPLEDRSPEENARARAAAAALLGGVVAKAPAPQPGGPLRPAGLAPALAAVAALGPAARPCAARLEPGFAWAARIAPAFPIYPRGHARDAAGAASAGCALKVVSYVTPVSPDDVADFYWTAARRAGLAAQYRQAGSDDAIVARKAGATAVALIRAGGEGLTEVSLVTSGM